MSNLTEQEWLALVVSEGNGKPKAKAQLDEAWNAAAHRGFVVRAW